MHGAFVCQLKTSIKNAAIIKNLTTKRPKLRNGIHSINTNETLTPINISRDGFLVAGKDIDSNF